MVRNLAVWPSVVGKNCWIILKGLSFIASLSWAYPFPCEVGPQKQLFGRC